MIDRQREHWGRLASNYNKFYRYYSPNVINTVKKKTRIVATLCNIQPLDNVLEVGCGTGIYTKELLNYTPFLTAIDCTKEMLLIANSNLNRTTENVDFRYIDAHYTGIYFDNYFDSVVGFNVLQYLDVDKFLKSVAKAMKKQSTLCFVEPNALNPVAYLLTKVSWFRDLFKRPKDARSFYPAELVKYFQDNGFNNIEICYTGLVPSYKIFSPLSKSVNLLERNQYISRFGANIIIKGCLCK